MTSSLEKPMQYSRAHPFSSRVIDRYDLNHPEALKRTFHVTLDLTGSGIDYRTGDCIGVYPLNPAGLVEKTLHAMGASGDERVVQKRSGEEFTLRDFLRRKANISQASKKLLTVIRDRQPNVLKQDALGALFNEGEREALKEYLNTREIWDLLEEHDEVQFELQELCDLLGPLLPRLYSIASSPELDKNTVDLCVGYVFYTSNQQARVGVCSDFLHTEVEIGKTEVPIYLHPTKEFLLPENDATPVIMIGPGTGIAPFRGFMQERIARNAVGKNWLFFGNWHRAHDYYYEEMWADLEAKNLLRLDLAFSRDQDHKIYVQDRMQEHAKELWQWLQEGAVVYVCGDASRMAKDVDAMLHKIAQEQGQMDEEGAKGWIKQLKKEQRYLRDVY